ncbi:MAG: hypothetical protein GXP25_10000, partial [Planctomycetes bacterium]|nr:hypothetical protein [Planctomycetota bacterium]
HNFGKGRVVCIAADFGMTDAIKYRYPDLVNMEPKFRLLKVVEHILAGYFDSLALVEVEPGDGIQVITNLTDDRRRVLVGLFNNDEFHNWVGKFRVRNGEIAQVTEWVEDKSVRPAMWIDVTIPAGEFKIFEIKTKENCIPPIRKIEMR